MSTASLALIIPAHVGKIQTLIDHVDTYLFALTNNQLIDIASKAKFEKIVLINETGKFDRNITLKLLSRKYLFGIYTVLFKSLPVDVIRYISNFFDFDITLQPRIYKFIESKQTICDTLIDTYYELLSSENPPNYIYAQLASNYLQYTVFTCMNNKFDLSYDYYKFIQQREFDREETSRLDLLKLHKDIMHQIDNAIHEHSERTIAYSLKSRQMTNEYMDKFIKSEHCISSLLQLQTIPEYILYCKMYDNNPDMFIPTIIW